MINAKTSLNRAALKGGAATLVLAMLAAPVAGLAQTATTTAAAAAEDEGTIVVTGSLIRNPNLVLSSPVAVVGAAEIQARQAVNAEALLRDLPGLVPNLGAAVNNGGNGANYVDLRGLGPNRNLALLDGDRLTPFNSDGQFDLNNVPVALVQRVDILTGGASTTYGADAITGVVNFITKQDFTGVDLRVTNGLTELGDGQTFRADLTIGGNFADGRGNATMSVGYQKRDPVSQGARSFSAFQLSSANGRAAGGSPTSTPTTFQLNDTVQVQNNSTGTGFVTPDPDGYNFAPLNLYQTPFERFNIFAQAKYEIADNIEVYARGLFSKYSTNIEAAPSGIFGDSIDVNINNPFISAAQRTAICAAQPTLDCSAGSRAIATIPGVYRRATEVGPRIDVYRATVFDYKAGVRGDITDSLHFDLSGAYGESGNTRVRNGYTSISRVRQAALADSTTTCRTTTGGCVPLNLFGPSGSITPAMVNFIEVASQISETTSLGQVHGAINGDLGFSSPLATSKVAFAIGAEYRKYGYSRSPDLLAQTVGELGGAGGAITKFSGGYSVKEIFGEANIPLIEDRPGFDQLSIDAGIRQSQYQAKGSQTKTNATTYKIGGAWQPVKGFKLRGGYSRAVRAANIGELFAPVVTGLVSLSVDPCSGSKPVGNAALTAVCLAQGATAGQIGAILDPAAGQAAATGGGNPNLVPEVADTFTVGGVLTPTFAPGLSLTVDYFNIKVKGAVSNPTPSDVINACFASITSASATNPACTSIRRNPATGRLSGPAATTPGLPTPLSNLGVLKTSGIDFAAAYNRDVGFAKLGLSFNATYTFENKFKATPTSINRECIGQYSTNCNVQPKFQFNQRTSLDFDTFNVSLLWRHLDPVRYEDILARRFSGTVTGFGELVGTTINTNKIKSYNYFDLSGGFNVGKNLSVDLLVSNLFNSKPPITGASIGPTAYNNGNTFPSTYDVYGRRYTATVGLRF